MDPALSRLRRPDIHESPRFASDLCQDVPPFDSSDSNSLVLQIFSSRRDLLSLVVTENDRPIGLINRDIFLSQMSKPFHPISDDGLDAAFLWLRNELIYAGARTALYIPQPDANRFETFVPDRMGVGYIDSLADHVWTLQEASVKPGSLIFICTDGLVDEVGGERRIAFGKSRVLNLILQHRDKPPTFICDQLTHALIVWQGTEPRRDDITLFRTRTCGNFEHVTTI